MVQLLDKLSALAQGDGFTLQSSDGRINPALTQALHATGVSFEIGDGMAAGLSNKFALSAAGGAPPPLSLQPDALAPRVQFAPQAFR